MQLYFQFFEPVLKWLEKPEVVISLSIIFIIIRLIYVKFRSKKIVAEEKKGKKDWRLEVIDICIIAMILVFGIVWNFLLKTYYIPSGSMIPTLHVGDRLIANRFIYYFHPPRRGDVVVFTPPQDAIIYNDPIFSLRDWLADKNNVMTTDEVRITAGFLNQINEKPETVRLTRQVLIKSLDPETTTQNEIVADIVPPVFKDEYIKRVIAVAGDKVNLVSGYSDDAGVYVNGVKQPLSNNDGFMYENDHRINGLSPTLLDLPKKTMVMSDPPRLIEHNGNGTEYFNDLSNWITRDALYKKAIQPLIAGNTLVIPKDCIFVMGDNRSDGSDGSGGSFDSRYWGVVPLTSIKARGVAVFWPIQDVKTL